MSTWRIFSDANNSNNSRWEAPHRKPFIRPKPLPIDSIAPRQGSEADWGEGENPPVFRTASGKPVAVKQSSMARAAAVLGEIDFQTPETRTKTLKKQSFGSADGSGFSNNLFQTASGKYVGISSAGLKRAKALLGLDESGDDTDEGFSSMAKSCVINASCKLRKSSQLGGREGVTDVGHDGFQPVLRGKSNGEALVVASEDREHPLSENVSPAENNSSLITPEVKFHTAGGRSISVSSNALQRARRLLGDPDVEDFSNGTTASSVFIPLSVDRQVSDQGFQKEDDSSGIRPYIWTGKDVTKAKSFVPPLLSSAHKMQLPRDSHKSSSGTNLIHKFNEEASDPIYKSQGIIPKPKVGTFLVPRNAQIDSYSNGNRVRNTSPRLTSRGPLLDISNKVGAPLEKNLQEPGEKRKFGSRHSAPPFKKPRCRFSAPLINNGSEAVSGPFITTTSEESPCKQTLSVRYPCQAKRLYVREFFGSPPSMQHLVESSSEQSYRISANNAQNYVFFDGACSASVGVESFAEMLIQSGAQKQHASKEWVANHYKWIVWKLACYDRHYPAKGGRMFLSVTNVIEELKYRYEREVNHGRRSTIKRILEGDTSPSSVMVLCISAIYSNYKTNSLSGGDENGNTAMVELTDGWYSVNAVLDTLLLKQLAVGKMFVGQKLRVCGAGLSGWVGPVSPFEATETVSLLLHINGTYRAHWGDRLGLCKHPGAPLAFRSIKVGGGPVPQTLVIIKRIYPLLYKERFRNGDNVIRSEKLEARAVQCFNQRRSIIVEGITSCSRKDVNDWQINTDCDSEENTQLFKALENAAEPEMIMSGMSPEQLASFSTYQAKLKEIRHLDLEKSITKALADAGLSERNVSAFMRVKVAGLWSKRCQRKHSDKEGMITIWEPTAEQRHELVEGLVYAVSGLVALTSDSNLLYCSARGSSTRWLSLSHEASKHFDTSYVPRKPVLLSNLGDIPLSCEFDMAGLVVYIGDVFKAANQKKQWMFITDCSASGELSNPLLAISFCLPECDGDLVAPINGNLVGSTVGFCNLVKEEQDQQNQLWVAKMTENSAYCLNYDLPYCSHLKDAATAVTQWSATASLIIERLRLKVLSIVGDGEL